MKDQVTPQTPARHFGDALCCGIILLSLAGCSSGDSMPDPGPSMDAAMDASVLDDASSDAAMDGPTTPPLDSSMPADAATDGSVDASRDAPGPVDASTDASVDTGAPWNDAGTPVDPWGPPTTVTLAWVPPDHAVATHALGRTELEALLPDETERSLLLREIGLGSLMPPALDTMRAACGANWPFVDVSGACPAGWSQAQVNLHRILSLTPATANLTGTSSAGLEEMASVLSSLGILDSGAELLADLLGVGITEVLLPTSALTGAWVSGVLDTHPEVTAGARVPITVHDALRDLTTLDAKLGASGSHPGVIDGSAGRVDAVLGPGFAISLQTTSNLHWHDGLDLASGLLMLAIVEDGTGPTFEDPLEYDFDTDATFSVTGTAAAPTADLALLARENGAWLSVGTSRSPEPRGDGAAWSLGPFEAERVIADAGFRQYGSRRAGCDLCAGAGAGALLYQDPIIGVDEVEMVVGRHGYDEVPLIGGPDGVAEHFPFITPNPAGWARIWSLFGLSTPFADQYLWDTVLEIAERRLRDGGVAEGDGMLGFTLLDVPVGVTGDQVKNATRAELAARTGELSALLLGDYNAGAQSVDFYLARGDDGVLRLHFVHPTDPVPAGTAIHATPGFFADEALTTKISSTTDGGSGDTVHEKLRVDAAQVVYVQDGGGDLYRLDIQAATAGSVSMDVRRHVGT